MNKAKTTERQLRRFLLKTKHFPVDISGEMSYHIHRTNVLDAEEVMQVVRKVFVDVYVLVDKDGKRRPLRIQWEDGTVYTVERLLNRCRAKSLNVGGGEIRYTVQINGKETFIYEDNHGKWFVEGKC